MTSEVVLMNRHAVALAADSATTVTHWHRGEREERYFQGANKIFNLSRAHPVGLMTYGTASLQGVPWEVVVKAFRRHLGSQPHTNLDGYAQALFKFTLALQKLWAQISVRLRNLQRFQGLGTASLKLTPGELERRASSTTQTLGITG